MHRISSLTFVRKILKLFSYSIEKAFHGNQIMRVKKERKKNKQNKTETPSFSHKPSIKILFCSDPSTHLVLIQMMAERAH